MSEQAFREDYLYFLLLPFTTVEQQKELGRKTKINKLDMASQGEKKLCSALVTAFFLVWEAPRASPGGLVWYLQLKQGLCCPRSLEGNKHPTAPVLHQLKLSESCFQSSPRPPLSSNPQRALQ